MNFLLKILETNHEKYKNSNTMNLDLLSVSVDGLPIVAVGGHFDLGAKELRNIADGTVPQSAISKAQFEVHSTSTANPHSVTKTQVGLANVDNVQQLPLSYLDIDDTLAADSDVKVPSQKAVKAYVDGQIGGSGDFADSAFRVSDQGDATKKMAFEVSAVATGTVRTVTMPNANVNLGLIATAIQSSEKATNNGVATLDSGGKVPASQLPNTVMELVGEWNANTNTPALSNSGAAVAASRIIQDLTYTADTAGADGNDISVAYTTGATAGAEVVSVIGTAISVQIESGVSTATQVKAAVDAFPAAAALVNVVISGTAGNAQTAAAAANLQNGRRAASIGDIWEVTTAGTADFGAGNITFAIGDWAVYSGSGLWYKSLNSNAVTSVNSQTGTVVLNSSHIAENTNLYFTDSRAKTAAVANAIVDGVTDVAPSQNAVFDALAGKANTSHTHVAADVTDFVAAAKSAAVADALANGVTDVAPSQNAVFDALALKQDSITASAGVKKVGADVQGDYAVTKTNDNAGSITVRQVVYVKADGDVDLARADTTNLYDFALAVVEDASIAAAAAGKVVVRRGAIIGGFSGLTPGKKQYLSRTTSGALVDSLSGFVSGEFVYSVGRAISATELSFDPQFEFEFA